MKTKVFLDTNVLVDFLLGRGPSYEAVCSIFQAARNGLLEAVVTTQSIIDACYIIRKNDLEGFDRFRNCISKMSGFINIDCIDASELMSAFSRYTGDFEDDAQFAHADSAFCDIVITSDREFAKRCGGGTCIRFMTPLVFMANAKSGMLIFTRNC